MRKRARRSARSLRLARAQPLPSRLPRRGAGCASASGEHQRSARRSEPAATERRGETPSPTDNETPPNCHRNGRSKQRPAKRRNSSAQRRRNRRQRRRLQVRPMSSARTVCAIMWPRLSWPDSIRTSVPKPSFLPIALSITTKGSWIVKKFVRI